MEQHRSLRVVSRIVFRDITERKRAREEIQELNQSLRRHATQVEAANEELEAFSYSVSHDLRAPLRGIDGFSLALMQDYADQLDPTARGFLERIRAATNRMAELIDDLLNLARVSRAELCHEDVDLSAMAKVILADCQARDPERRVECKVKDGAIGHGDSRLLRVVLKICSATHGSSLRKPRTRKSNSRRALKMDVWCTS